MQWQVIDTDLISGNISNAVEIFWVTGTYTNTILDQWIYLLWWPALSWDQWSSWWYTPRWALRFYDDWTKIIIMWSSEIESNWAWASQHWLAWYYAEILKSTWVLTTYTALQIDAWTTTSWWNTKMVYTNIWWSNRYGFTRASSTSSVAFFYFNWTSIVQWWGTEILAASNIWSSSMSYRWRTLTAWVLLSSWDTVYYGAWWCSLQTLQYS